MMLVAREKRRRESLNRSRHRLGIQAKDLEIVEEDHEEENSGSGSASGSRSRKSAERLQQEQAQSPGSTGSANGSGSGSSDIPSPNGSSGIPSPNAVVIENMNINRSRHRNVHDLNMSRHSHAPKVYASGHSLSGLSEGSSFVSSEEPDVSPPQLGNEEEDNLSLSALDAYDDEVDSDLEVDLDVVGEINSVRKAGALAVHLDGDDYGNADAASMSNSNADDDINLDSDNDSLSGEADNLENAIEEMYSHRNSVSGVTDRASLIDSIEWLSRHVPQCVIKQITHDVLLSMGESGLRHAQPQAPVPPPKPNLGKKKNSFKGIVGKGKEKPKDRRTKKQRRSKLMKRRSLTHLVGGKRLSSSNRGNRPQRRMSRLSDGRLSSIDLTQLEPMQMPHGSQYDAALLFIDMSGFTNLAQKLDVDKFSKVSELRINIIFSLSYNIAYLEISSPFFLPPMTPNFTYITTIFPIPSK